MICVRQKLTESDSVAKEKAGLYSRSNFYSIEDIFQDFPPTQIALIYWGFSYYVTTPS